MPYRCIDCKVWLPIVRWLDLIDAILFCLWPDLLNICERILEFLHRRVVCGSLRQAMWAHLLGALGCCSGLSSSLDAAQVQRGRSKRAQNWFARCFLVFRILSAIVSINFTGSVTSRCMCWRGSHGMGRGGARRRGNLHHYSVLVRGKAQLWTRCRRVRSSVIIYDSCIGCACLSWVMMHRRRGILNKARMRMREGYIDNRQSVLEIGADLVYSQYYYDTDNDGL